MKKGWTASEVIRGFIQQVINGNISVDSAKPIRSTRGVTLTDEDTIILNWFNDRQN